MIVTADKHPSWSQPDRRHLLPAVLTLVLIGCSGIIGWASGRATRGMTVAEAMALERKGGEPDRRRAAWVLHQRARECLLRLLEIAEGDGPIAVHARNHLQHLRKMLEDR